MPRRSKNQIFAKILSICRGDGASKTKIVYQANLNFSKAGGYLDFLIRKGFLEVSSDILTIYRTTEKGETALESLKAAEKIYS